MATDRNHMDPERFLKYLAGELSDRERHELERQLEKDPFAGEAMEGLESLGSDEAREDILSLRRTLRKRLQRRRKIALYGMAAAVASLLIVGTLFLQLYDFKPSQEENEKEYLKREVVPLSEPSARPESTVVPPNPADAHETEPESPLPRQQQAVQKDKITIENPAPPAESDESGTREINRANTSEESADEEVFYMEAEPREPMPQPPDRAQRAKGVAAQPSAGMQDAAESADAGAEPGPGNISGRILSRDDLTPLPGATVSIKGLDVSTSAGTDGRFELPVTDTENTVLVANSEGMEAREVPAHSGREVEILMDPSLVSFEEVEVTGENLAGKQESVSGASVKKTDLPYESGAYTSAGPSTGFAGFESYVKDHIRWPEDLEPGQKKVVVLTFTVTSSGGITGIETVKSPGDAYTNEAIRLLKEGPAWNPAMAGQIPEDDQIRIRIVFKRSGD